MNAGPDVEREISDWLLENAPMHAPDRILDAAARTIDRTKQRRFGAAWRNPMTLVTSRRLVAALFVVAAVLGAGWIGRSTASVGNGPTSSPPSALAPSASPGQTSAPSTAASSLGAIPDGTYAARPIQVADIIKSINADAKLTAVQKTDVIENLLAIKDHTTLTVSIELRAGQYTEHQAVDGVDIVGSRATFWFVDPTTLVLHDEAGISGFEVTRVGDGFTLKSLNQQLTEEDTFVVTLLTSQRFTLVP